MAQCNAHTAHQVSHWVQQFRISMHELSCGTEHSVRNSLNRMGKMPSHSDSSLFVSGVRALHLFFSLSGKRYNTSAVKPRTCTRLKTQLFHARAFYSKRRKALLFVPPPAKCDCFNCVWHRPLSHSPTLSACPLQSTVAVQTLLLSGVRRRGDLQRLGGTPGKALDQQAAHRWAKKKYTRVTSPKENMWSPRWIKAIFISCNYSTLHQCFNIDVKWEMCFSARWKRKSLFWSS